MNQVSTPAGGSHADATDELGDGLAAEDTASQPADDLDDITPEEYQQAAEILAQQSAEARESTDDGEHVSTREQRYRQRAQAAEADRDRLASIVEDMRRNEIQRLASERLADPADLFRDGTTVEDVLDEQGRVDPARLNTAVDRVLVDHPHWAAPIPRYRGPMFSGASQGREIESPSGKWQSAFEPKPH